MYTLSVLAERLIKRRLLLSYKLLQQNFKWIYFTILVIQTLNSELCSDSFYHCYWKISLWSVRLGWLIENSCFILDPQWSLNPAILKYSGEKMVYSSYTFHIFKFKILFFENISPLDTKY